MRSGQNAYCMIDIAHSVFMIDLLVDCCLTILVEKDSGERILCQVRVHGGLLNKCEVGFSLLYRVEDDFCCL